MFAVFFAILLYLAVVMTGAKSSFTVPSKCGSGSLVPVMGLSEVIAINAKILREYSIFVFCSVCY